MKPVCVKFDNLQAVVQQVVCGSANDNAPERIGWSSLADTRPPIGEAIHGITYVRGHMLDKTQPTMGTVAAIVVLFMLPVLLLFSFVSLLCSILLYC